MPQFALPTTDALNDGWVEGAGDGDADFFDELDEGFGAGRGTGSGPDDITTYWVTPSNPAGLNLRTGLATIPDPLISSGHIVRTRNRKDAAGGRTIDLTIRLRQAGTIIATRVFPNIDEIWTTRTIALSTGEADAITDYSALQIETEADTTGTGAGRVAQESTHELETPSRTPVNIDVTGAYRVILDDLQVQKAGSYLLVNETDVLLAAAYQMILQDQDVGKLGQYAVFLEQEEQKTGQYTIIIVDNDFTKAAEYLITVETDIIKSGQYALAPTIDIQKLGTYAVGNVKDVVKTGQYTVLTVDQSIDKFGQYALVLANQDIVKSGQYLLLNVIDITKAGEYRLLFADQTIDKFGEYRLLIETDPQKLADYRFIFPDNEVIIGGDYNVSIPQEVAKTGRYVLVGEVFPIVNLFLPLDEQDRQPGDIEQLDITLSLAEDGG